MDGTAVTLEPWSPWPLGVPAGLLLASVVVSMIGTRRRIKPVREAGYVGFLIGAIAGVAMWWSLSGMWDTAQRQDALVSLGYDGPTFTAGTAVSGDELPPIAWQAERDGVRVRGVLVHDGGDRWIVRETGG